MKPIHLDCLADYRLGDGSKRRIRCRIRSMDHNNSRVTVEPADGQPAEELLETEGEVRGAFEDVEIVSTRCRVPRPVQSVPTTDAEAYLDDLTLTRTLVSHGSDLALAEGSHTYGRWLVSGSRLLERLVGGSEMAVENANGGVSLRLDANALESERWYSGHAVNEYTLRPYFEIETDGSGTSVAEALGVLERWRRSVERMSSVLSFYSGASVQWLGEELGLRRSNGEEEWLRRIYRFPRVLSVPSVNACGPWSEELLTRIKTDLWGEAERLGQRGDHLASAIDFYVSSFVLAAQSEFFALTTALEAAKEAYLRGTGSADLLGAAEWRSLERSVRKCVRTAVADRNVRASIVEKMRELNRPAYGRAVSEMVRVLGVPIEDIYPNGFSFISMRNEMVHQGRVPEPGRLSRETVKLRSLVERVIRGILGGGTAAAGERAV